jgi:hypothetical protein
MMRRVATYPLSALLLALTGCGSSNDPTSSHPSSATTSPDKKVTMNGTCPTNTGFAGDEACLAPPSATEGFQLHYGPTDYDDPVELAKFTLKPGQETNDCFFTKTPNDADIDYSGYDMQMRPGSHHLIGQSRTAPVPDGFGDCELNDQVPAGLLGDSQKPILDYRTDPAAENQGFGRVVPAHTQAVINFHVINTTNEDALREAWLNYYYIQPDQLKAQRGSVDLTGGLAFQILPGTHKTYQYSCSPNEPVRILNLWAHMHAHALRMTIWKVVGTTKSKLLENYSWEDPTQLFYDSAHTNTPADPATATPGGDVSGDVTLNPTDAIQWECEVNNDSNITLTFRNEVFTGEMCLVAGSVVRADEPTQLGDFICNRN